MTNVELQEELKKYPSDAKIYSLEYHGHICDKIVVEYSVEDNSIMIESESIYSKKDET